MKQIKVGKEVFVYEIKEIIKVECDRCEAVYEIEEDEVENFLFPDIFFYPIMNKGFTCPRCNNFNMIAIDRSDKKC